MRTTICLCMLVKNEAHNITAALESVYKYIDYAVIMDTGSTDGTQKIISEYLLGRIHFEIIQDNNWLGFGAMRTKLLHRASDKATYLLILDGDNIFHYPGYDRLPELHADAYYITKMYGTMEVPLLMLFKSSLNWEYEGVVHEYPVCRDNPSAISVTLPNASIIEVDKSEGRPERTQLHYINDALLIDRELVNNQDIPDHLRNRYSFYLGQSYKDAGWYDRAITAYKGVAYTQGGWIEQRYIAMLTIARLLRDKQRAPSDNVTGWLFQAVNLMPHRLEAAYELMAILNEQQQFHISRAIGGLVEVAHEHNQEPVLLFVERDIYEWKFYDVYSLACYYAGDYEAALMVFGTIDLTTVPIDQLTRLKENEQFFQSKQ
jgi:glycosyltransferase involved in cell wall biosynthesis